MRNRVLIGVSLSALVFGACGSETENSDATSQAGATQPSAGAAGAAASASTMGAAAAATTKDMTMTATPAAAGAMITSDEMWSDGKMLAGSVEIAAGAKVQIEPGAQLMVASGTSITVHGSLEAAAKDNHAKLEGMSWTGIVVAQGGSLSLSGVDIQGAKEAIKVSNGNKLAEYSYGTVTGGLFRVDTGGTLTLDHSAVKGGGYTYVSGTLKATFVDWSGAALALGDPTANVFVADSKITGTGGDFFTASGGQLLHVEYSTIDNTHCPFHFNTLSKFEIDHVTTGGMTGSSTSGFGLMIYNADAGPHTISFSNFNDPTWHQTRPSTVINVMNTYIPGAVNKAGQVTFMPADASGNNAQMEPNADAQPRGTPGPG